MGLIIRKNRIHQLCGTDIVPHWAMVKTRRNVTLVIEEGLLLAARRVALDRSTSVNRLVREYLAALVEEPSRRLLSRARLKRAFETGLVGVGDRKWSRDDLHDR